jgi:exonuclease SbcD
MHQPFRFIHASDLHLDRPPRGLSEVPDHLRSALIDAPYRAAERVFDAAIAQHADFVVLAGDVLDPLMGGPRGVIFLQTQFERLRAAGVSVYWAAGAVDHFERWLELPMPGNVLRFPLGRVQRVVHHRDNEPIAQLLGISVGERGKIRTADFQPDRSGLFALAVAYGIVDSEAVLERSINYWALGGEHERRGVATGPLTAHYCGTSQGRRPQESGPRGCTLVQVDDAMQCRTSFIVTDAVRFHGERVVVGEGTTNEQLYQVLDERTRELLSDAFGPQWLIEWTVSGCPRLAVELDRGKLAGELTTRLRADHGGKRPSAWSVSIVSETSEVVREEHDDEDTLLGEYLRTVRHYAEHPEESLDLDDQLNARHAAGYVGAAVSLDDLATRQRVLSDVARLGVELLTPEERAP